MRILDTKNNNNIDNASLFLTQEEATQLISYLEDLIKNPSHQHSHLSSDDYKKEVTIWLYDLNALACLPPKVQKYIRTEKWPAEFHLQELVLISSVAPQHLHPGETGLIEAITKKEQAFALREGSSDEPNKLYIIKLKDGTKIEVPEHWLKKLGSA